MGILGSVGLQRRIILLVSFGLLVVFGLFFYFGWQAVRTSIAQVEAERITLAEAIANDVDNAIEHTVSELERVVASGVIDLEDGDMEPERQELRNEYLHLTIYHHWTIIRVESLSLMDGRGQMLLLEPATLDTTQAHASHQAGVEQARTAGRTVVHEVTLGLTGQPPLVSVTTPVKDRTGNVTGTLSIILNPTPGVGAFSSSAEFLGKGYRLELVNERGLIVAGVGPQEEPGHVSSHLSVSAPLMREGKAGAKVHKMPGASGEKDHIVAFAPLRSLPWGVMVEQESDLALAVPGALQRRMMLLGGIALLVALAGAWWTTRSVVKPIRALTAASQRIAEGRLDEPVEAKGRDEIGILARRFDEMRSGLKASREEVEAWSRASAEWGKALEQRVKERTSELSALYEASRALTSTLDLDAVLKEILLTVQRTFPRADAGALFLHDESRNSLRVASSFGFDPHLVSRVSIQPGEGCIGEVFLSRAPSRCLPVAVTAELRNALIAEYRPYLSASGAQEDAIEEGMCVPLIYRENALGSVILYNLRHKEPFSEHEVELLQALANQAAVAISNARLFQEASVVGTLRELDRLKTEFVARASHELRTPLTSIKSFAETLLRPDLGLQPSVRQEFLEGINRAADRLAGIIDDLLTVSRIEAGKLQLQTEAVSLPPLLEEVVAHFHLQEERGFRLHLPADLPLVLADPHRLTDVLINLLSNAVKYSAQRSPVSVQARAMVPEQVSTSGLMPEGPSEVVISVTDRGIGIPASEEGKLFQPFSQIRRSGDAATRGVGLGLYICKTYVEAMGGRLWVESSPGRGSTFSFTLPVARGAGSSDVASRAAPGLSAMAGETAPPSLRGCRILVVDDEQDVLNTAQIHLRAYGFEALTATTGEEALRCARDEKPDAVVLDILMPGMDGLEVARRLRRSPDTKSIPIVFLSALAQKEDEERGRKLGAKGYIKKPFSARQLCDTLTSVLLSGAPSGSRSREQA